MKNILLLLFTVLSTVGYSQSGSFVLGIPGPCGGCVSSCVTAGVCSPVANGNCMPPQTVMEDVLVPANSYLELTITTVACSSSTDGLDGGDDLFVDGVKIVDGSGNTRADFNGCFSSSSAPRIVPIQLTANRRDETVLVEWEVFPGTGTGCVALPIELIDFTAVESSKGIQLDWSTATEQNNSHFEIEFSTSGGGFKSIGEVKGFENSSEVKEYVFVHDSYEGGSNYYRLRQVDLDGRFSYSPIVVVQSRGNNPLNIRPSLVKDYIHLTFESTIQSDVVVQIVGVTGQQYKRTVIAANDLEADIEVSDLYPGIYIIRYNVNGIVNSQRFVKL